MNINTIPEKKDYYSTYNYDSIICTGNRDPEYEKNSCLACQNLNLSSLNLFN